MSKCKSMASLTAEQYTSIACTGTAVQCKSKSKLAQLSNMIAEWYNSNRIYVNIIQHGSATGKSHDTVAIKLDTGIAENHRVVYE